MSAALMAITSALVPLPPNRRLALIAEMTMVAARLK
jgi:hypothetical protein